MRFVRILGALAVCAGLAYAQAPVAPNSVRVPATISYWVGNPGSTPTTFDLGIQADNNGVPGALLCSAVVLSAVPQAGWSSVAVPNCPALQKGTQAWVSYLTPSNTLQQGLVVGACAGTTTSFSYWAQAKIPMPSSPTAILSLPQTFPAASPSTHQACYSLYVTFADGSVAGEQGQVGTDSNDGQYAVATPFIVPPSVVTLSCTPSTDSTTADPGTTTIQRATTAAGPWTTLTTTAPPNCAFTDGNVKIGLTYYYQAYFNQDGNTSASSSNVANVAIPTPPTPVALNPPTGLTITLQ
jgi:hypothetical protein